MPPKKRQVAPAGELKEADHQTTATGRPRRAAKDNNNNNNNNAAQNSTVTRKRGNNSQSAATDDSRSKKTKTVASVASRGGKPGHTKPSLNDEEPKPSLSSSSSKSVKTTNRRKKTADAEAIVENDLNEEATSSKPGPDEAAVGNDVNVNVNVNGEVKTPKTIQYWLMKAEPESRIEKGVDVKFSIDDLKAKTEPEGWDGVRNPVARNNMRAMRKGDLAFFYHSNCKTPGIVGVMRIVEEHQVDESAFDPAHPYYDPKSTRDKPKWELVKVEFVKKFDTIVDLKQLKSFAGPGGALENMQTLKQSRLSVSGVQPHEWRFILDQLGEQHDFD